MPEEPRLTPLLEVAFPAVPVLRGEPCQLPDAQSVAEMRQYYREELGLEIDDERAYQVVARLLRLVWAVNLPDAEGSPVKG